MSFKFGELKFKDVPAEFFGKGVVIRVTERNVAQTVARSRLEVSIRKNPDMKEKSEFYVGSGLMSVCVNPANGEPAFADEQLVDFVTKIPGTLYLELTNAHYEVNPTEFGSIDEPEDKKKDTIKEKKTKS